LDQGSLAGGERRTLSERTWRGRPPGADGRAGDEGDETCQKAN